MNIAAQRVRYDAAVARYDARVVANGGRHPSFTEEELEELIQ